MAVLSGASARGAAVDAALGALCALLVAWSRFTPIATQAVAILAFVAAVALLAIAARERGWHALAGAQRALLWLSAAMLLGAALDFQQFGFATVAGLCALSVGVEWWTFVGRMLSVAPWTHTCLLLAYGALLASLCRGVAGGAPLAVLMAIGVPAVFSGLWWSHMLDSEQLYALGAATGIGPAWWMWGGAVCGALPAEMLRRCSA